MEGLNCMATNRNILARQDMRLVKYMLTHRQYRNLIHYLHQQTGFDKHLLSLIYLAQALVEGQLDLIDELAPQLHKNYLLKPTQLQKRTFSFMRQQHIRFKEYRMADYFRALTPLLVDVMRLITQRHIVEELDTFIIPIVKETEEGEPIYRGLQWNEEAIEASDNLIRQTFKKYYGDYFKYEHYISSSHLTKIIVEHMKDEEIKQRIEEVRLIEKYVRNLLAHEAVTINEDWLIKRCGKDFKEIHKLLKKLMEDAGLTDMRQWNILKTINEQFLSELTFE